jgi:hypothetical protein
MFVFFRNPKISSNVYIEAKIETSYLKISKVVVEFGSAALVYLISVTKSMRMRVCNISAFLPVCNSYQYEPGGHV